MNTNKNFKEWQSYIIKKASEYENLKTSDVIKKYTINWPLYHHLVELKKYNGY